LHDRWEAKDDVAPGAFRPRWRLALLLALWVWVAIVSALVLRAAWRGEMIDMRWIWIAGSLSWVVYALYRAWKLIRDLCTGAYLGGPLDY
jgi:hypothetical protein